MLAEPGEQQRRTEGGTCQKQHHQLLLCQVLHSDESRHLF